MAILFQQLKTQLSIIITYLSHWNDYYLIYRIQFSMWDQNGPINIKYDWNLPITTRIRFLSKYIAYWINSVSEEVNQSHTYICVCVEKIHRTVKLYLSGKFMVMSFLSNRIEILAQNIKEKRIIYLRYANIQDFPLTG